MSALADRRTEARRMRTEGATSPEIAAVLGVSASTVRNWLNGGVCVDCGAPTDGSRGVASVRCATHAEQRSHEAAVWTSERLLAEARRWYSLTGFWPVATHWHSSVGPRTTSEEFRSAVLEFRALTGPWPHPFIVSRHFGSWPAFMAACGGEAPGTCQGVKHGQRAAEMRAAIDRLNKVPQRAGESPGQTVPASTDPGSARPAGGPLGVCPECHGSGVFAVGHPEYDVGPCPVCNNQPFPNEGDQS